MACACQSKSKWLTLGVLLSAAAACAMLVGNVPAESSHAIRWNTGDNNVADVRTVSLSETDTASRRHADSLSQAFRDAAAMVMPSVVTIRSLPGDVTRTSDQSTQQQIPEELRNSPFFKRFFEEAPNGGLRSPQPRGKSGMGSGVIVDSSGIILTNNHVVDGAGKLIVKLHDGREFQAVEWKTDAQTDIAVVQIDAGESLPAAMIGDSDRMLVGDWVLAVGAPFGLNESVTTGIVSAKSRGIGITAREDFIQTDAAINPGNSGGPLVNLDGQVIGINTAISTTSGGYQGIGFAVPINLARWISDELVDHGSVRRAFLGVGIQPVTNVLSEQFGLGAVKGAVVTEVREGTPARKAGLLPGDVIVRFADREIRTPRDLQGAVERASLKESHDIVVIRDGREITLKTGVASMPGEESVSATEAPASTTGENSRFSDLGLEVSTLTSEQAERLNMNGVSGVLITDVRSNSPADRAGLQQGLVVVRVGRTEVTTVAEFGKALDAVAEHDDVLLLVRSGSSSRFVVISR
ncbi:MAG: Do family serine endopeptidase [Fuerstiella sp.]